MSSVSDPSRCEPSCSVLVDVELVHIEGASSPNESESTEEQPLQLNRSYSSAPVKSYQSTAPTKTRTVSTASDDSNLLPDIGYSAISSKHYFFSLYFFSIHYNIVFQALQEVFKRINLSYLEWILT